jgi:hypothetical protein
LDTDFAASAGEELSPQHLSRLLEFYERTLDGLGYSKVVYPTPSAYVGRNILAGARFDCLNHAYWMCDGVRRLAGQHRMEKAYRSLGIIQGMLFLGGVFTLDEIMSHDRAVPVANGARKGAARH